MVDQKQKTDPKPEQQKQAAQPTGQERAMALANSQVLEIKRRLEIKKDEIRFLLGDDKQALRLMMGALMRAADDAKIRECEPNSVVRAVIQAALCGAEIAAGLGEGYLVPYNNKDLGVKECTFLPGYRLGQRKVQEATGMRVVAGVVCAKDHWKHSQVPLVLEHTEADGEAGDPNGRGARLRSYACALDDSGRVMFAQTASAGDIEQAKIASRKGRDADSPAWRDWEDRMWRKLAIMRLAKEVRAFKSTAQLDRLLDAEEAAHSDGRSRGFIGDLPEPRVLPPSMPEEGRGRIGAPRAAATPAPAAPEPVAVAAADAEPPHDAVTGVVQETPNEKRLEREAEFRERNKKEKDAANERNKKANEAHAAAAQANRGPGGAGF